jgi:thioredoxin-related protein
MKKNLILALIFLAAMGSVSCAGKKDTSRAEAGPVAWLGWDQALASAQSGGKFMVVDVYTDWCHWCKVMDQKTYADPAVAGLMKKGFVAAKLNAEGKNIVNYQGQSYTEAQLARSFNVEGFPTTMVLASDGTVLQSIPGYIEAPVFGKILEYFDSGAYKNMTLDQYLSGKQ